MSKKTAKPQKVFSEPEPFQELPDDVKTLHAESAKIKEKLRKERLRANAYDTMIDIAEDMFKFPSEKKLTPNDRDPACEGLVSFKNMASASV